KLIMGTLVLASVAPSPNPRRRLWPLRLFRVIGRAAAGLDLATAGMVSRRHAGKEGAFPAASAADPGPLFVAVPGLRRITTRCAAPGTQGRAAPGTPVARSWYCTRPPAAQMQIRTSRRSRKFERTRGGGAMKFGFLVVAAGLGALIAAASTASAQGEKAGVERLYILNCGEGVAGDISRWSPGVNVGKSMDFVDNCY